MVNGQLLSAISPAVLAREVVALEDVLLIEGQGILKGPVNIAIESNDRRKNDHQRGREDDSIRIFHSLCLPGEEKNDGPLGGADLQGLIRLVQHQDLYLVDHGIVEGIRDKKRSTSTPPLIANLLSLVNPLSGSGMEDPA
jgi:hypothetical protein